MRFCILGIRSASSHFFITAGSRLFLYTYHCNMTYISHIAIAVLLVIIFLSSYTNSYTILGGIEPSTTDEKDDDSIKQTLRHFENVPNKHQVRLQINQNSPYGAYPHPQRPQQIEAPYLLNQLLMLRLVLLNQMYTNKAL